MTAWKDKHFEEVAELENNNTHGVFGLRAVFDIIRKTCRFDSCPLHKICSRYPQLEKGYAYLTRAWQDGDEVHLQFPMSVRRLMVGQASPKMSMEYGPVVLATTNNPEGLDALPDQGPFTMQIHCWHVPDECTGAEDTENQPEDKRFDQTNHPCVSAEFVKILVKFNRWLTSGRAKCDLAHKYRALSTIPVAESPVIRPGRARGENDVE